MKLAAIYNAWDGVELLPGSIKCLYKHVDEIIIVWQDVSNFGEKYSPHAEMADSLIPYLSKITFIKYDPIIDMGGSMNERAKRNLGLDLAKKKFCTHFLSIDVDEYYKNFELYKSMFIESGQKGSACRLQTYFKKPTLMFSSPEDYYVPFIHAMDEETKCGTSSYKFYVDPTRTVNESDVVELPFFMDHFSWCRKDIERKTRNSSANINIRSGKMLEDYKAACQGYFLTNWNRHLMEVEDTYGLSPLFES